MSSATGALRAFRGVHAEKAPCAEFALTAGDAREGIRGTSAATADPGTSPDCPRRRGRVSVAGRLPALHPPPPLGGKLNGPSNAAPPLLRRQWQYFRNPHIHAALHNTDITDAKWARTGKRTLQHENTALFILGYSHQRSGLYGMLTASVAAPKGP